MAQREPPKLHCNIDRISNLPRRVIEEILSWMPIKDMVRTSVLSNTWNTNWASVPHLVFDDECVSHISPLDKTRVFINIVDHVLLLRNGPIHTFELVYREDGLSVSDVQRWILHVSKKPINVFTLEIYTDELYKIPNSLFSCQSLIHLELTNCLIKPLWNFKGFKNLKSLELKHVLIAEDVFENLIKNCLKLEDLWWINNDDFNGSIHLNIDAPNLKLVRSDGVAHSVRFKNTLNLDEVYIQGTGYEGNSGELLNFFVNLPNIRRLGMGGYFLKNLANGNVPNRLPHPFAGLNYLSLEINFAELNERLTTLCLLRSSPYLNELDILSRLDDSNKEGTVDNIWSTGDHLNSMFAELRLINIRDISGNKSELDFISFMLLNSPALERMIIKPVSADERSELLKAVGGFRRASVVAKIILMDH